MANSDETDLDATTFWLLLGIVTIVALTRAIQTFTSELEEHRKTKPVVPVEDSEEDKAALAAMKRNRSRYRPA